LNMPIGAQNQAAAGVSTVGAAGKESGEWV
jgi:hypothetical protein